MEGKKGVLFWDILEIVRHRKPKYVLLENVDSLLKSPSMQRGRDFGVMLASFRDAGYTVEWNLESTHRFEVITSAIDIEPIFAAITKKSRGRPIELNYYAMIIYSLFTRLTERIPFSLLKT